MGKLWCKVVGHDDEVVDMRAPLSWSGVGPTRVSVTRECRRCDESTISTANANWTEEAPCDPS